MDLPKPRAYVDWTIPCDDQGQEIGVCRDPETYSRYIDWLADHLYSTDIPVPASQTSLLNLYKQGEVRTAIFDLSDSLGCSLWDAENIEYALQEGQPYSAIRAVEKKAFDELPKDEKVLWEPEDFITSREDCERIGREFIEARAVPKHIQHADIPYRPILAALFKSILDKAERRELLNSFYSNFYECASK